MCRSSSPATGGTSFVAAPGTVDIAETKNGIAANKTGAGRVAAAPNVTCFSVR